MCVERIGGSEPPAYSFAGSDLRSEIINCGAAVIKLLTRYRLSCLLLEYFRQAFLDNRALGNGR